MTLKAQIYGLAEGLTPPLLFAWFRNSIFYRLIIRVMRSFGKTAAVTETVAVTNGTLRGAYLKLDPTGSWQQQMLLGTYDQEIFSYLEQTDWKGKVLYDIGAHIGYHTLMFARYSGPQGKVVAFEPNPTNVARIEDNLALNPDLGNHITIKTCALSDQGGTTTFVSSADIESGISSGGFVERASTLWEKSDYIEKTGFTKSEVTVSTIDDLVENSLTPAPDLLKIDVEGAEGLVLAGGIKTIKTHRPLIIVECHSINATYETMRLLADLGYQTEVLKRELDGRILIAAGSK